MSAMSATSATASIASAGWLGAGALQRLAPRLRQTCRADFDPALRTLRGTAFELSSDEHRFALGLLDEPAWCGLRKHNLWLFRTDQTARAGDFVIVDVSRPPRARGRLPRWDAWVVELKMGERLRRLRTDGAGSAGAGVQLQNAVEAAHDAVREAAQRHRRVRVPARAYRHLRAERVERLVGSTDAVLDYFG